jgi:hypothetical protein
MIVVTTTIQPIAIVTQIPAALAPPSHPGIANTPVIIALPTTSETTTPVNQASKFNTVEFCFAISTSF